MTSKQKVLVTMKLPQLQNLIKRDPHAYREEFTLQHRHFINEMEILKLRPANNSERFCELLSFIGQVSSCYPNEAQDIPKLLIELMETQAQILHADVRAKLFQALITLRNKTMIDPLLLLKLCFHLFSINDKTLRASLSQYIFNDIKNINIKKHDDKTNKNIQALLFKVVSEDTTITAKKSVEILANLYRRRIWTDERTVNVLGEACKSKSTRVLTAALNFFLGIEIQMLEDDDDDMKSTKKIEIDHHEHSKKTKKRARQIKKQIDHIAKEQRNKVARLTESTPLFPAIMLLHNPQELAENLYLKLRQSGERFEIKLLIMNFISRLIGCHKLILLSFYSFIQKYLTSHQIEVTKILAYLIQSCHDLIPPEELIPVLKTIAYNFITERCTNEVLAVGINTVREVLTRVPALLLEPDMEDFIQDLSQYGHKAHKSVMIAAHSVVNFVREHHPSLLRKSDRGKGHDLSNVPKVYGSTEVLDRVPGTELLDAYERGEINLTDDELDMENDDEDANEEEEEEDDDDNEVPQLVEYAEGTIKDDADDEIDMDADEDEGWVDVEDDDDDDDEEEEEEEEDGSKDEGGDAEETVIERGGPIRRRIEATRFLTAEDFAMIERLKAAQAERAMKGGRKRAREDDDENDGDDHAVEGVVNPDSLAGGRTGKATKAERLMRVLEGRTDNRFEHEGHAGGLTNKEKLRKKNYMMVRKGKRSVANKIRKSNSDARWEKMKHKNPYGRDRRKRRRV